MELRFSGLQRGLRILAGLVTGGLVLASACTTASAPATPTAAATKAAAATPAKTTTTPAAQSAATNPPAATAAPALSKVLVAGYGTISDAPIVIANDKGWFREQGIEIEMVPTTGGQDVFGPLSAGQLDVATSPLGVATLAAVERGIDVKIVADKSQNKEGWEVAYIILRKDLADSGQVKTPADLKGMKISYFTPKALSEMADEMMLEQGGLKPDDVELTLIPFGQEIPAYANKSVAAGYTMEPSVTNGLINGAFVKWIPQNKLFGGNVQSSTIVYGTQIMKNKDLGQRWMTAYLKGVRFYTDALDPKNGKAADRDAVMGYITQFTPLKDRKVLDQMEMPYIDPNGMLDRQSVKTQYAWYVGKGYYQGKLSFDDVVDTSFADYAVQKLGKR